MVATLPIRRLARLLVALVVVPCAAVRGQEAPEGPEEPPIPLYERQPFDRIIVKGGGPNRIVEVQPLDLPNRRVPNPFPSGALKFRLSDTTKGTNEYSYNWTQIERVELFEQILLAEAAKLTSTGKFDEAYDYYAKLMRRFPDVPGLEAALNEYLVSNAMAAYGAQEFDRALAISSVRCMIAIPTREASAAPSTRLRERSLSSTCRTRTISRPA